MLPLPCTDSNRRHLGIVAGPAASLSPTPWPTMTGDSDSIYGGPGGDRTHDLRIKSPLLYQLSYRPT